LKRHSLPYIADAALSPISPDEAIGEDELKCESLARADSLADKVEHWEENALPAFNI